MKKRTSRWLAAACVLAILCALLLMLGLNLNLLDALHLGNLLQQSLEKPEVSADLRFSLQYEDQSVELDTALFRKTDETGNLYGLHSESLSLYFADGRVIFDNGRAYALDGVLPAIPVTGKGLLKLLPMAEIEKVPQESQTLYRLTVSGELLHRQAESLPESGNLCLEFMEQNELLTRVDVHYLAENREISALISLRPDRGHTVPDAVEQARTAENLPSVREFEPLVKALYALAEEPVMAAQLHVSADCGPVALTDTMQLYRKDSGVYLERWNKLKKLESVTFSTDALLGLGYQLCRDGQISRTADSGSYGLIFPAQSIKDACVEMLPEIELLPITYDDGALLLTVEENQLTSAKVDVSGSMPVVIAQVEIALGLELCPAEPGTAEIPAELQ